MTENTNLYSRLTDSSAVKRLYRAKILLAALYVLLIGLAFARAPLPFLIGTVVALLVVSSWIARWKCPTCGRAFFIGPFFLHVPWRQTCRHCGFRLRDSE